jgi:ribonuclease P protein component
MLSKDAARPRLGMAVARRIGGAVVRNRVKRRVRECFRLELRRLLPANTDLVVIARIGAGELESAAIAAELKTAISNLSKLGTAAGRGRS